MKSSGANKMTDGKKEKDFEVEVSERKSNVLVSFVWRVYIFYSNKPEEHIIFYNDVTTCQHFS